MWLYALYFASIYFGVSPINKIEYLYIPTIFKGIAFMLLVIAFGVYAAEDLESPYLVSNTFFMISTRSVFAPVISTAIYSNYIYATQITSLTKLAGYYSAKSIVTSTDDISGLFNQLQSQSLLSAIKITAGHLLIISIAIALLSAFIPFHKTLRFPIVRAGHDMA